MSIGTDVNTFSGSIFDFSETLPTADTIAAFRLVGSYVRLGELTDGSTLPTQYTQVPHVSVEERTTKTLKGVKEAQIMTLNIGAVSSDAGQALLKLYNDNATYRDTELTMKLTHKNTDVFYAVVLVTGIDVTFGDANTITSLAVTVAVNSNTYEDIVTYYTVTFAASTNGSIIGSTTQQIASGSDCTPVYADADSLYEFTDWDEDSNTDNPRTVTSVAADATYTATFTLI